jgi:hypothetical protein
MVPSDRIYRLVVITTSDKTKHEHQIPIIEYEAHKPSAHCKCNPLKLDVEEDDITEADVIYTHRVTSQPIH